MSKENLAVWQVCGGAAVFTTLCDAALLEEARDRYGLEGLNEVMGWRGTDTFYSERSKLAKRTKKFTPDQRARLITALVAKLKPEEQKAIEEQATLQEILSRLPPVRGVRSVPR